MVGLMGREREIVADLPSTRLAAKTGYERRLAVETQEELIAKEVELSLVDGHGAAPHWWRSGAL